MLCIVWIRLFHGASRWLTLASGKFFGFWWKIAERGEVLERRGRGLIRGDGK